MRLTYNARVRAYLGVVAPVCGPRTFRKLKEWIIDCQKKKQPLTRSAVWDEALKLDASMYGGRDAEGWHIKMSRWYYKFLQREDLFIKEKETGGRGRPRSRQQPPHLVSRVSRSPARCLVAFPDRRRRNCANRVQRGVGARHVGLPWGDSVLVADVEVCRQDHAAHDIGRENEGGGERVQEEEETAAKRPKRPAPCYNDHQLRKLEHFYMMGRDRTDYDHMAAAVTGLNGARCVLLGGQSAPAPATRLGALERDGLAPGLATSLQVV